MQTDYAAVYRAWKHFRKGKRPSLAIHEFAYSLEANIQNLADELVGRIYRHGGYQSVTLEEKKRRDLAVAGVRDRVAHRLLYDYLIQIYDKSFDADVWSCRSGRGLHRCLERIRLLLAKHSSSYVWRADITKFFDNVDQNSLLDCLRRKLWQDDYALWLCGEIISSYHNIRTEQNRTEQNRTEQNRTEQNRTEQNRTE